MNVARVLFVIAAAFAGAASATSYGEKGFWGHGYASDSLGGGRYVVVFTSNGWTSLAKTISYAHRRAGELCPNGYDVLDSHNTSGDDNPEVTLTIRCH